MIPVAFDKPAKILTADNPRTKKPFSGATLSTSLETGLPGQKLHAFRQKSGSVRVAIAVFTSAGLPNRSLAQSLVAEAKVLRPSASVERAK